MQTFLNVGVDVAKDAVVVACAAQSFPAHSITNQRAPLLAWLKSLPAGSRIGLESTGGYHELLADPGTRARPCRIPAQSLGDPARCQGHGESR